LPAFPSPNFCRTIPPPLSLFVPARAVWDRPAALLFPFPGFLFFFSNLLDSQAGGFWQQRKTPGVPPFLDQSKRGDSDGKEVGLFFPLFFFFFLPPCRDHQHSTLFFSHSLPVRVGFLQLKRSISFFFFFLFSFPSFFVRTRTPVSHGCPFFQLVGLMTSDFFFFP